MVGRKASLPAITFTDDEIDIVVAGLVTLSRAADQDGELADAAEAVLARIEGILPDVTPGPASRPRKTDGPHHGLIREAIRTETRLRLSYIDRRGAATRRTVWPLELGAFSVDETFAAWCETRRDFRHFRLDRIETLAATGQRYPTRRRILLAQLRIAAMENDY